MAEKLNLAVLNKRKEDISKNEMNKTKAGLKQLDSANTESTCDCSLCGIVSFDVVVGTKADSCECGSVWMHFGMAWGVAQE